MAVAARTAHVDRARRGVDRDQSCAHRPRCLGDLDRGFAAIRQADEEVGDRLFGGLRVKDVGKGLWEMTGGFVSNLFEGNFSEAFSSVTRGLDHAIFQSTERLYSGMLKGAQGLVNGVTDALGPIGEPLRWVSDRAFDISQTALEIGRAHV